MFRLQIKNTTVFRTPLTPPHPYPDYHSKLITKIVAAVKLKPTPASYSPAEKGENQLHFTSFDLAPTICPQERKILDSSASSPSCILPSPFRGSKAHKQDPRITAPQPFPWLQFTSFTPNIIIPSNSGIQLRPYVCMHYVLSECIP